MRTIVAMLALAIAASANAVNAQTAPNAYKSLQPSKQFAEGTGHGMARVYKPRNKAEFVALLRNSKELRVTCERLVSQMAEIHKLPFENCEGAAAEIARNSDYDVVACRSGMFDRDNRLTVTNSDGSAFGVWQRPCLAGETVLVYKKNRTIASTMCANVSIPVSVTPPAEPRKEAPPAARQPPTPAPAAPGPLLSCPDVWTLKINVWGHKAMTLPGVASTHAKEELGEKESRKRFVGVPHVSRTHGRQFREAYANGELDRSTTAHRHRVFLIMTPQATGGDATITSEQFVADVTITGTIELRFTRAQLNQWDAIRIVAVDGDVESPPTSGLTGLHELRFFNRLPGTTFGEWDNNKTGCLINVHEIEPSQIKQVLQKISSIVIQVFSWMA